MLVGRNTNIPVIKLFFLPIFSRIFSKCLEHSHQSLLTQTSRLFILVTDRQTDSTVEGKESVYMVDILCTREKSYLFMLFPPLCHPLENQQVS